MKDAYTIYKYGIDAANRITYVDAGWLGFARANGASELSESRVLGKKIWDFIAGRGVRRLYREIFHELRSRRREMVLPFRCDSPDTVRHMELLVRAGPSDEIDFEGRLIHTEERDPVTIFSHRAPRNSETVPVCSFCRRLQIEDEWVSGGSAVVRRRWFSAKTVPQLSETLCPECQSRGT